MRQRVGTERRDCEGYEERKERGVEWGKRGALSGEREGHRVGKE